MIAFKGQNSSSSLPCSELLVKSPWSVQKLKVPAKIQHSQKKRLPRTFFEFSSCSSIEIAKSTVHHAIPCDIPCYSMCTIDQDPLGAHGGCHHPQRCKPWYPQILAGGKPNFLSDAKVSWNVLEYSFLSYFFSEDARSAEDAKRFYYLTLLLLNDSITWLYYY